jgi:AcrR family transcriptional regulator
MNAVSSDRPKYQLKARAERQRQTRERIVAATVALHREVGPAKTTVADVARRAGVQRLTVYNNFPRLSDLLAACQRAFLTGSPPPDFAPPASSRDAAADLDAALRRLYGWYRGNAAMERNVHRDRALVEELDALLRAGIDPRLDAAADGYARRLARGRASVPRARALVRLALEFSTWELLDRQGLSDAQIAGLMVAAVRCAGST